MTRFSHAHAFETKSLDPIEGHDNDNHVDVDDAITALTETTTALHSKTATDYKRLETALGKLEAKMGRPGFGSDSTGRAANDNKAGDFTTETKAFASYFRSGDAGELKSMSVSSDPDGGYSVTNQLSTELMRRLYNFSPIRQLARVVQVGSFSGYEEPRQIGDTGGTWVGENESRPATTTPTLGMVSVPLNEIYSNQPISQRLIDDSRFDIGAFAIERIVERMARSEGTAFVTGDGVNKPMGFLSVATDPAADFTRDPAKLQFVASGGATTISLDGLKNLYWALRAPHRANGSWVMSSATASILDQLKSGDGVPVWRAAASASEPPTLLGRPVYYSEDMPAVGAGAMAVAFGNFTAGYLVIDRPGIRLVRDPFTARPSIVIYGYRRVGGGVADTDAIKLLKISA